MDWVSWGSVRMSHGREKGVMKAWTRGELWRVVREVSQHYYIIC